MNPLLSTVYGAAIICSTGAASLRLADPETRPFRLAISLKTSDNLPVPHTLVTSFRAYYVGDTQLKLNEQSFAIRTSEEGVATFTGTVPSTPTSLNFGLGRQYVNQNAGNEQADAERASRVSLLCRWAFPKYTEVLIIGGPETQKVTITGIHARSVVATVVQAGKAHPWKDLIVLCGSWTTASDTADTSKVKIAGLPRYQTSFITVGIDHRMAVVPVPALPAVPEGQLVPASVPDVDLGTIDLGDPNAGTPLTATIATPSDAEAKWGLSWQGASFVRQDGTLISSWYRNTVVGTATPEMQLVNEASGRADDLPRLPPGTYYILPGPWMATNRQWQFLRLLRAGALPTNHGVPTITVTKDQAAASVTITPETTDAALKALLSTPVPDTGQTQPRPGSASDER